MRRFCVLMVLLLSPLHAQAAEYFDSRFEPGYDLLKQGEFDKALENFEQLKTDTPDSELVDYSIASVFYQRALAQRDSQELEGAIEQFSIAKQQFGALSSSADDFLREQAPLNAANATAQIAKLYSPEQEYKERVQGLKQALDEYDAYLGQYPGHRSAQRNRDHVSYLLKQLLRNPPPEEEPEESEDEENSDENQGNEDGEESDEGEEDSEGEESDEEDDSENDDENKPSDPSDENSQEDAKSQQGENGKTAEEQNIEAILESLEAINQEEQKNLRRTQTMPRIKEGKWW